MAKITAETLRAQAERRWLERQRLADGFERAAAILDQHPQARELGFVVRHLEHESSMWRTSRDATDRR